MRPDKCNPATRPRFYMVFCLFSCFWACCLMLQNVSARLKTSRRQKIRRRTFTDNYYFRSSRLFPAGSILTPQLARHPDSNLNLIIIFPGNPPLPPIFNLPKAADIQPGSTHFFYCHKDLLISKIEDIFLYGVKLVCYFTCLY